MGWEDHLPDYLISRVSEHGRRRAAEMREVAETLEHVGIEPTMALATAERQKQLVREMVKWRVALGPAEDFPWHSLSDATGQPTRRPGPGK